MIDNIPAAKNYRNAKAASQYDKNHIKSLRGWIITLLDQFALYRAIKDLKNINLLMDIPCGTGRVLNWAAKCSENNIGSDISYQMMVVSKGKNIAGNRGYAHADIFTHPFKRNIAELIISNRFYFHLPANKKTEALKNMAEISNKYVLIEEAVPGKIARLRWRIEYMLGLTNEGTPWYTTTWLKIQEDSTKAGLKIVKIVPRFPVLIDTYFILFEKQ